MGNYVTMNVYSKLASSYLYVDVCLYQHGRMWKSHDISPVVILNLYFDYT